jgi:branched-chain amino acid transport system permease protein
MAVIQRSDTSTRSGPRWPRLSADALPWLLVPALALLALPLVGALPAWITLTLAGLGHGHDDLHHGLGPHARLRPDGRAQLRSWRAFISIGAFVATLVLLPLAGWMHADNMAQPRRHCCSLCVVAMAGTGALGLVFERVIVAPVYGQHLKQILVTMGGMIIAEQMINVLWGAAADRAAHADGLSRRHRDRRGAATGALPPAVAVGLGLVVWSAMLLVLNRTKLGPAYPRGSGEWRDGARRWATDIRRLFVACSLPARRSPGWAA